MRYGKWVGNPKGIKEDLTKCIETVYHKDILNFLQCTKKRGNGPDLEYCKTHAKIIYERDVIKIQGAFTPIRYKIEHCITFRNSMDRFGGLSNFAGGFPLKVNGMYIPTSEALYQAMKFPSSTEMQTKVIKSHNPGYAKILGSSSSELLRPDWDLLKVKIMYWALRVKLACNTEEFTNLLIDTEDKQIVENSAFDDYWGAISYESYFIGANVLGRLLMRLRQELKSKDIHKVEPLNIPNFKLCGKKIKVIGD